MPALEEHCNRSLKRYGTDGRDIHSWIDEPASISGPSHRKYRHDEGSYENLPLYIKEKYGALSKDIFLDHLIYDEKNSYKRWTEEEIDILKGLAPTSINYKDLATKASKIINRKYESIYDKAIGMKLSVGEKRICKQCEEEFITMLPWKIFCSNRCKKTFHKLLEVEREKITIKGICTVCGSEFEKKSNTHTYCSAACSKKAAAERVYRRPTTEKKGMPHICKNCGAEFSTPYPNQLFCSSKCTKAWYKNNKGFGWYKENSEYGFKEFSGLDDFKKKLKNLLR